MTTPVVAETRAQLAEVLAVLRSGPAARPSAVVMTMGALHDGHGALITAARDRVGPDGVVLVTVFVNPTQFGRGEDLAKYPRTWESDLALCGRLGADVVFKPDVVEVYGVAGATSVTVDPGPLGDVLEGASRPDHFRGVLTVVAKLLHLAGADIALFGEKDYQQLCLIRRMVSDLDFPVEVVGVPTVREPDGLAMSSRNRYLDAELRAAAPTIHRGLQAGVDAGARGAAADEVVAAVRTVLDGQPLLAPDYVVVTDPLLGPAPAAGPARLLTAVRAGSTRLLDNVPLQLGGAS